MVDKKDIKYTMDKKDIKVQGGYKGYEGTQWIKRI
jgi:hypothetical protein